MEYVFFFFFSFPPPSFYFFFSFHFFPSFSLLPLLTKVTLPLWTTLPGTLRGSGRAIQLWPAVWAAWCAVPPDHHRHPEQGRGAQGTPSPGAAAGHSPGGAAASTNFASSAASSGSSPLPLSPVRLPKADAQPAPTCPRPAPELLAPPFPYPRVPPGDPDNCNFSSRTFLPRRARLEIPLGFWTHLREPGICKTVGGWSTSWSLRVYLEADAPRSRRDAEFTSPSVYHQPVLAAGGNRFSKEQRFQWVWQGSISWVLCKREFSLPSLRWEFQAVTRDFICKGISFARSFWPFWINLSQN